MTRDPSLHILQHALGLDDYGQGNAYRNHYVTGPECDGWDLCMGHVEAGRMVRHDPHPAYGGNGHYCFTVTDAGRAYVREHSPKPPKVSRARQRYLDWLRVSDAYPDMTFRDWIGEPGKRFREEMRDGREHAVSP